MKKEAQEQVLQLGVEFPYYRESYSHRFMLIDTQTAICCGWFNGRATVEICPASTAFYQGTTESSRVEFIKMYRACIDKIERTFFNNDPKPF